VADLLRSYLRPYRVLLVAVALLLLVQAMTNLFLPSINAAIINDGVLTGDVSYIVRMGGLMLLVSLLLAVASVVTVYFSAKVAMAVGRDLRADLFRRVESLSLGQVNVLGVPSLITRTTNDVQQIQMLVLVGLTMMVLAPVTAVGAVIMAVRENAQLSLLLVVVVPVMLLVILATIVKAVPLFRAMQVKIDRVNLVMREKLTGIRVIRAFNRTEGEQRRFAEANDDLTETALRVTQMFALVMPALLLVMNLSSVAVIWFGGQLVADGSMPIGNLTAFLAYLMQLLFSVMMAVMTLMMVPRAAASADRIGEVLGTQPDIVDPETSDPGRRQAEFLERSESTPRASDLGSESPGAGLVELVEVGFQYPGAAEPVVSGVTLTFRPGTTTAIIGGTGSGKTTLVNLIPRLLEATAGSVRVGGVDVRQLPQEQLWQSFGIVPQRAFLFSGTVASNVRFGRPDATDEEVWQALEVAQAADFVRDLAEGLEAPVEQGGANLSGGQRQRLSIARAIVRRAPVLILDDSFSALDYATDARLRQALRAASGETTVIVVAQRVSSIRGADQIVVVDYGRVVGVGTHDELVAGCETYREILASQAELAAS